MIGAEDGRKTFRTGKAGNVQRITPVLLADDTGEKLRVRIVGEAFDPGLNPQELIGTPDAFVIIAVQRIQADRNAHPRRRKTGNQLIR